MPPKSSKTAEEKRERFVRVAERRTNKVLAALRLLKKCANRQSYIYSEDQAQKVLFAIEEELTATRRAFEREADVQFSLLKVSRHPKIIRPATKSCTEPWMNW